MTASWLASTCGWYRFDQGQHYAAGKLWNAALSNAHTARDRDQGAGLVGFRVSGDPAGKETAVEPLSQALVHTRHPMARSALHLLNKPLARGLLTGKYYPDRPPFYFNAQHASPDRSRRQAEWVAGQENADIAVSTECPPPRAVKLSSPRLASAGTPP
ncbi:hypothetical protein [Streptomyces sp. NRRL S-340]|uniref:hypothetical protein n=1 Tax=Streptomyces sp. NRRL S-340 TaxID=1463901 RepID=UPI001F2B0182|nr:hypothetical protein [Streptomyces sp. NRRL S-340]